MKLLGRRVCFVLFLRSIKYTFWACGVFFFLWGFGKQLSSNFSPPTLPFILKENGAADNEMGEPNIIRERAGGLCPSWGSLKGRVHDYGKVLNLSLFCKWKLWQELSNNYAERTGGLGLEIKAITLWEGFLSQPPISRYCPLWLMLFGFCLTDLLNPTSGRDASHVCLISFEPKTHVYHMCTCGTHVSWAQSL